MKAEIEFISAQELAKKFPDSFIAPSQVNLDKISEGSLVKVGHNKERFWAKVEDVKGDEIIATVDNDLVRIHPFSFGDRIIFQKHHIHNIHNI